jgi:hypothetical protein
LLRFVIVVVDLSCALLQNALKPNCHALLLPPAPLQYTANRVSSRTPHSAAKVPQDSSGGGRHTRCRSGGARSGGTVREAEGDAVQRPGLEQGNGGWFAIVREIVARCVSGAVRPLVRALDSKLVVVDLLTLHQLRVHVGMVVRALQGK